MKRKDVVGKLFSTRAIHAGQEPDPTTGSLMTPVYFTSTYVQEKPGEHRGYDYARTVHPTRKALEENLASLESGKHGVCFSSGMGAITSLMLLFREGDHVVSGRDVYGGTYRAFTKIFEKFGVEFSFVDTHDPKQIESALTPNTRMIWLETPSNPLLHVTEIAAVVGLAKKRKIKVAVDNTFATPYLQNPLLLGADIVVHSTTKYLGGHSDIIGGCVIVDDDGLAEKLRFVQNSAGAVPGPMDCFLALRGTKTLSVRMERHCYNARKIADWLRKHPDVEHVYFPGLKQHPLHSVARRQMRDFGGMISFELKGRVQRALRMISKTSVFTLAESLGGIESLIGHPATMTHASIPKTERVKAGLSDSLIRLSVGIEDAEDLIEDLDRAIRVSK